MKPALIHARLLRGLHRLGFVPKYEDVLERTYRNLIRPGDTVVDIGAHTGRHTAVFAELVGANGTVHAFEPLPQALKTLRARRLGNNVHIHPVAVAEHRGQSSFVFARGTPEESGLKRRTFNRPELASPEEITVEAAPLDDFSASIGHVTFIKIDIEGGEIGCLKSGREVVDRCRPWISVEYGHTAYSAYGHQRRTLFDLAASMDYLIGDLFGAVCDDLETWEQVCDTAYWDWYLVPRGREIEWSTRIDDR